MNKTSIVAIVVLHWKGLSETTACLESLGSLTFRNWDLVLVLNGACQTDSELLRSSLPPNSHVLQLTHNQGFTGGCNAGIHFALDELGSDFVLLLNNDTVVDKDLLSHLMSCAEEEPRNGVVGAKTFDHATSCLQFTVGRLLLWRGVAHSLANGQEDRGQFNAASVSDYVQGSCMLIRADVLRQVGYLDEQYFAYWEETDFCVRARRAGYQITYEPRAVVWHKGGSSSASTQVLYYLLRNNIYFMRKHARWYQWLTFLPYFVFKTTPFQSAKPFVGDPFSTLLSIARGYYHGFRMRANSQNRSGCG